MYAINSALAARADWPVGGISRTHGNADQRAGAAVGRPNRVLIVIMRLLVKADWYLSGARLRFRELVLVLRLEALDLFIGLVLGDAMAFLETAGKLVATASNDIQLIVCDDSPTAP